MAGKELKIDVVSELVASLTYDKALGREPTTGKERTYVAYAWQMSIPPGEVEDLREKYDGVVGSSIGRHPPYLAPDVMREEVAEGIVKTARMVKEAEGLERVVVSGEEAGEDTENSLNEMVRLLQSYLS